MSDNHFRIDPNRRAGRLVCQRLVARSGEAAWIMTMLAALTVSKQRGAAMEQVRGNLERSVANRGRVYEGLKTSTRRIALLCGLPPQAHLQSSSEDRPTMQRTTRNLPARLHRGRVLSAAVLTASALLLATAPQAVAQDGVWAHYDVTEPKVITLEFDTDLLAFDLCWSDHTDMVKEQIVNGAIAQMNDPTRLHVIRMPGLPPFYRRTSNAPVWHDLNGGVITSSDVLPNRASYHIDVEQALIEIAGRIRAERPGAKLAFEGFELQPLPGRPPAYEELGALQDFYITDRTIFLNHVGHILHHALNSTFYRARVDFAEAQDNWLVFPNQTGAFSLASLDNPAWPPEEIEPEIMALWGGDGDEGGGDGGGGGGGGDPDESVVLVPGDGFAEVWGDGVEAVGSPGMDGYDAKAIARWNVVPYQTVEDEPFSVGVVAFHINNIDRVEFYLEGGPAITVTEMTHNPRTDTWEYWAVIDPMVMLAMNHPDGPIELRAIAYPKDAGEPRVLEPLMLNTNSQQTLPNPVVWCAPWGNDEFGDGSQENPFRQPYRAMKAAAVQHGGIADGVTVFAMPGDYHWGDGSGPPETVSRWATVCGAPGTDPSDVVFTSGSSAGFKTKLLAVSGVSFENTSVTTALGAPRAIWIDNSECVGPGRDSDFRLYHATHWAGGLFITRSSAERMRDGFVGADLVRASHVEDIGSDAFSGSRLVVSCSVDGIDSSGTNYHPDVYQFAGSSAQENFIVFGLRADNVNAQPIFSDDASRIDDVAFVNVLFARPAGADPIAPAFSQWCTPTNHLLLWKVSLPNSTFVFRSDDMSDISVRGTQFYKIFTSQKAGQGPPVFDENWFDGNHFVDGYTTGALVPGSNATVGDPLFTDMPAGDFTPLPDSPLRMRLSEALVPIDVNGEERSTPGTVGAIR